jgi:hypothetical protein
MHHKRAIVPNFGLVHFKIICSPAHSDRRFTSRGHNMGHFATDEMMAE